MKSDDNLLTLTFELLNTQKRGKGYWKFNNQLLLDEVYIRLIKDELKQINLGNNKLDNKNTFWDFVKCQLRTITISYSISKSKKRKEMENSLLKKIENLEKDLANNRENLYESNKAKEQWETLENKKVESIIFRSKLKWVEQGERNTKFFFDTEKRNYNQKHITKLISEDQSEITDPVDILEEERQYYKKLYSSERKLDTGIYDQFLKNINIPKLNDLDKDICETPLKIEEIGKALKDLSNDKTPGTDGFTTNFYKFFWPDIKHLLYDAFRFSFEKGELSQDQRRGILNLIPKANKDLRFLKHWRPISILNTDYKILAKALASRLQEVLPKLVNTDQAGYIKGRYIGENVRIIEDIMTYTELKHLPGYIILIDFEKAFDSVSWDFLLNSLLSLNFGRNFIKWIQILYTSIESCVTNNGYSSRHFQLNRGIRQGCPLSALLFILVAEIMAIKIRSQENIKGIRCENTEFKIVQLADDTTVFVSDTASIGNLISVLQNFELCSGLKINIDKTEIIPMGTNKNKILRLQKPLNKIKVNNGTFKTLGIWFSYDHNKAIMQNYQEKLNKMQIILNIWKSRCLSWKR